MDNPTVSFVVPCYALAHYLPECVNSILGQTFRDLEVLIMDDRSPDNTAEVARKFNDARVRYVRNETNLGALANYNKGISLSRGKYVWLISADDYLRVPYVLQRYVELMERHPTIAYTFCPAVNVVSAKEEGALPYSSYGEHDRIIAGPVFLKTLLYHNLVVAPTAMARRECYDKISYFPLNPKWNGATVDFIWGGDWYLWCLFALQADVGYLAEPMVCYRDHDSSSTNAVLRNQLTNCFHAEAAIPWQVKKHAEQAGIRRLSRECLHAAARVYADHLTTKRYRTATSTVTMTEVEKSLCGYSSDEQERCSVRARIRVEMGDKFYQQGDFRSAGESYRAAGDLQPWLFGAHAKRALLSLGKAGKYLRRAAARAS
jgi:glycosyltransferase involved in cell wall biosynthesis